MDVTMEEARALVADKELWPHVRDFLCDFAPQIHESWLGSSVVRWFGSSEEPQPPNHQTTQPHNYHMLLASPRVKRFILDSLGVEPCFHTFPKDDKSRLLLLDGETLLSIVKWLGAIVCADELRHITDGTTVRALKAALPGIYPEVFGYTAYFKKDIEASGELLGGERSKLNADFVVGVGHSLLCASVAHLPEPLLHRFRLKLPKQLTETNPNHPTTPIPNLQLLLKLRFPEAYKLCC